MKLKIISYNLNGIRSALRKDLIGWLKSENPDILLIQETKAKPEQIDLEPFSELGYKAYFHSAHKNGYSGVAIFSKIEPDHIEVGCGIDAYDSEGRVLRADIGDISVLSVYFPSGSSGDHRQEFKFKFLEDFYGFTKELLKTRPKLLISGDYNICHKPIDIHNPVSNNPPYTAFPSMGLLGLWCSSSVVLPQDAFISNKTILKRTILKYIRIF